MEFFKFAIGVMLWIVVARIFILIGQKIWPEDFE
jgi:hypothetical protein